MRRKLFRLPPGAWISLVLSFQTPPDDDMVFLMPPLFPFQTQDETISSFPPLQQNGTLPDKNDRASLLDQLAS